eukprot:gene5620-7762_t
MGKGGEQVASAPNKEVLIDGRLYDTTTLKHPGGSVIGFYAGKGIDASEAFHNFHIRSKKAKKYLENLPSRAVDVKTLAMAPKLAGQSTLMEDFNKLTIELESEGFFKPDYFHVCFRISEIIIMHLIGFALLFNGYVPLGILMLGIVSGRCGWLMHEGGHYSMTGIIPIDRALQIIIYGLGCGMSGSWWRNQHNKHHSMPQKLGHDVDLNTLPLVAFTSKVLKRMGFAQKSWIKLQAFLFPVLTTSLVALGWQFYLHPRHIVRTKQWSEAVTFIARYVAWSLLVTSKFGLYQSIGLYLAYTWIGANYIFINFAVSHTHLDVVPKEDTQVDWVRYSAIYTMNVSPGPFKFISWWMSYLNFQIEHHLYPSMPQYRHPIISPRVKALFEKHGLKYDQRSYIEAIKVTFKNLHKVGSDVFLG